MIKLIDFTERFTPVHGPEGLRFLERGQCETYSGEYVAHLLMEDELCGIRYTNVPLELLTYCQKPTFEVVGGDN